MASRTTNYNLYKPDATDNFSDFREEFNDNMDIIDENLGGGGGGGDVVDVEVNGVSVLDPVTKIAEITSYEEVTQAEYDALPSSKLTDGIAYFIKDASGGNTWHNYSTDEQVVGTWIDGKPIYEKTWDFGSDLVISNSAFYVTNIDASNIETIVEGFGIYSTGATRYNLMANTNGTNIRLQADRTNGSANVRYLVLQYTKTTD